MAIENIQKKEEVVKTSKIKKAFKKMKNAFIVGTAALMITCGGEDTSSNGEIKQLPAEVEAYADQNNLKKYTFESMDHFIYKGQEDEGLAPLFAKFVDLCNVSDPELNIIIQENNILYDLDNVTIIGEMFVQNFLNHESFEVARGFRYKENYVVGAYAPMFNTSLLNDVYDDGMTYVHTRPSGFNYVVDKELLTSKDPYILECYARYGDIDSEHKFFVRIKVIPQTILNQMITDSGVSMEFFYERVKETIDDSKAF